MAVYPLSFSRMQVFDQCELRFDKQYVTASHRSTDTESSRYGKRVHSTFEDYLLGKTNQLSDDLVRFTKLLDKLKSMEGDKYYEHRMAVTQDKEPCGWDDADCWQRGITDWCVIQDKHGFGGDWKTGKPRDDSYQMKLMAAFAFEHFPHIQSFTTNYFWLFHPQYDSVPVTYTRDMLPDLWACFEQKAQAIDKAVALGVFPATPSGLCPWCPVYETCPSAKRKK